MKLFNEKSEKFFCYQTFNKFLWKFKKISVWWLIALELQIQSLRIFEVHSKWEWISGDWNVRKVLSVSTSWDILFFVNFSLLQWWKGKTCRSFEIPSTSVQHGRFIEHKMRDKGEPEKSENLCCFGIYFEMGNFSIENVDFKSLIRLDCIPKFPPLFASCPFMFLVVLANFRQLELWMIFFYVSVLILRSVMPITKAERRKDLMIFRLFSFVKAKLSIINEERSVDHLIQSNSKIVRWLGEFEVENVSFIFCSSSHLTLFTVIRNSNNKRPKTKNSERKEKKIISQFLNSFLFPFPNITPSMNWFRNFSQNREMKQDLNGCTNDEPSSSSNICFFDFFSLSSLFCCFELLDRCCLCWSSTMTMMISFVGFALFFLKT